MTWPGSVDSPDRPEKIELVSDGTSSTPTVNVTSIITAWTPYRSCSSSRSPGGSVCRIPAQELLEHEDEGVRDDQHERVLDERLEPAPEEPFEGRDDEERHEERPDQGADALAIMPKETTNSSANCARPMTISISQ